jgi:hypothetical protein
MFWLLPVVSWLNAVPFHRRTSPPAAPIQKSVADEPQHDAQRIHIRLAGDLPDSAALPTGHRPRNALSWS